MLLLSNANLFTVTQGLIKNGCLLIKDGKIEEIGTELQVSEDVKEIDCSGKNILPGLIDAHTHVGIGEEAVGWEGRDYNETSEPVTPHLRAIDGINHEDQGFKDAHINGVTAVMTGPGSANVLGGQSTVLKTYGDTVEEMIVLNSAGVKGALGENPKRVYGNRNKTPVTRMGSAGLIRDMLFQTKQYLENKENGEDNGSNSKDFDLKKEVMAQVIKKNIPLRIHAHRADDIMTCMRIAKEFDIDITLEHCTEGHKVAENISEAGIPAVIGPMLTSRSKVELRDRTFKTADILYKAGVKVALVTDHPVIPIQSLPYMAALAVKAGLPYDEAVKAITINAAEILGIEERVGSLERGKDADIVIFDGEPLEIMSTIEMVLIDGQIVFENDSD